MLLNYLLSILLKSKLKLLKKWLRASKHSYPPDLLWK